MVQTTQTCDLFDKKMVTYIWQGVDAILENVSVCETIIIFDAKILIWRLPPFSIPKITAVWHV